MAENTHSHLDRHTFNMEINKNTVNVSFHTYYCETTAVYYELMPFVKMLKFIKDKDIINSVPRGWIKRCEDFGDEKFSKAQILPETLFGDFNAVHFIISSSDSKLRVEFIEKLTDLCFRKIENTRIQRLHHKHKMLYDAFERHASILDVIRDGLKIITEHHNTLEQILQKLYQKM
ncbi:ACH96143.1-like protein [Mauternbach virus]|uniref:ACH96143.1-like protein n=1 Tax=Mauternbach virus TaxID=2486603 RepID=A0A3G3E663_9VIRU|nr:ACH96143.1-like protein [Mauternbach virus]AYP97969.1 ACH96143.1-like protein [Mauternbach virus]